MSIPYESDDNTDDDQPDEYQIPQKFEDEEDDVSSDDDDEEGKDDESDDDDDDDDGVERGQLSDISFGELQKLRDTVGLKKYNEAVFGKRTQLNATDDDKSGQGAKRNVISKTHEEDGEKKKKMKSEPEEVSSKKQKGKPRNVVENVRRRHRDPRFDNLSGKFNEDLFEKSYSFVEDMKKEELKTVKKQFKKVKNQEKKSSLHKLLQRMEEQEKVNDLKAKRKESEKKRKREEFSGRAAGKKVFYMKKNDARKLELVDEYKKLKASGKIDKVLNRKRKMNASKEKKKMNL